MIILATAVILSLNSSGIISKAQSAKDANDKASMKEYVSVLEAEWELMTKEQREETGYSSMEEYVNAKLREKGFTIEESEDGWLSVEEAKKVLEIGDVVEYEVTLDSRTSEESSNGAGLQNISNKTDFTWRYIGISDDGKIMIAPDMTKGVPKLTLSGATGYLKGPDEIERLCRELYTTDKGTARSMTIEDVNKLLGYTGSRGGFWDGDHSWVDTGEPLTIQQIIETKGVPTLSYYKTPDGKDDEYNIGTYKADRFFYVCSSYYEENFTFPEYFQYVAFMSEYNEDFPYWLASSCVEADFGNDRVKFCLRVSLANTIDSAYLFTSYGTVASSSYPLRPVIMLSSTVQLKEVSDRAWSLK